jgi:CBS domain-containing protein
LVAGDSSALAVVDYGGVTLPCGRYGATAGPRSTRRLARTARGPWPTASQEGVSALGRVLAACPVMPTLLVKDLMSTPVVSLFTEQSLPLVEDIMTFKHIRHLPVVDPVGRLVGLVSHRDLLRAQISTLTGLTNGQRRARQADVVVRDIMTIDVWTVTPHTTAAAAARTLADHRIGCLPVVDSDSTLAGIITERDFLMYALQSLDAIEASRAA